MLVQSKELNFEGENIYVGIDVHLKSWSVSIFTEYLEHKTFRQDPDCSHLVSYLESHFPGGRYYSAYEAGFCGLWIHNELSRLNVVNIVVNPGDIPTTHKEHDQKSDPVDSRKIARSLRAGQLQGIYTHNSESLHTRSLIRLRSSMVTDMSRIKSRIKSLLYYYGIKYPLEFRDSSKHWSRGFLLWLTEQVDSKGNMAVQALGFLLQEYEERRKRLLQITRLIRSLSRQSPWKEQLDILRSVPGIGLITGMTFLVNIEDIHRFSSTDKFAGFLGIIPSCHSSGENDRKGEISSRRQKELRSLLVESSWIAARRDPALSYSYNKLCMRMRANKAIIRIARKLANRIYSVLKNQTAYVQGVL